MKRFVSERSLFFFLASALICVAGLIGCSGDPASNQSPDGDEPVPCNFDEDCELGQVCVGKICIGDVPDGDPDPEEETAPETEEEAPDTDGDGGGARQIDCPEEVQFGAVFIGETTTQNVTIQSVGTAAITLLAVQVISSTGEFVLDNAPAQGTILYPGNSQILTVSFTPKLTQAGAALLQVGSNADNEPLCSIPLRSEYKGTSIIRFDPPELLFGNVRPADPAVRMPLSICNDGDGNKAIRVTSVTLKRPDTAAQFGLPVGGMPSSAEPLFINPGNCWDLNVSFDPSVATHWPEVVSNAIVVANDADREYAGTGSKRAYRAEEAEDGDLDAEEEAVAEEPAETAAEEEIPPEDGDEDSEIPPDTIPNSDDRSECYVEGSANQESLDIFPNPIEFGEVIIGQSDIQSLTVQNQTGAAVQVTDIDLTGNHCEEFSLVLGDHGIFPFEFTDREVISDIGVVYGPLNLGVDQGCFLRITFNYPVPDQEPMIQYSKTPMRGIGRNENQKPTAYISRSPGEAPITLPIELPPNSTPAQRRMTLYGTGSNDPDGESSELTFLWVIAEKPDQSNISLLPNDFSSSVTLTADLPGTYRVSLVVTDTGGLASDPAVVMISLGVSEKVMVDMEFTGSGDMNANLLWHAPNGSVCSDTLMNAQHTCFMGTYGTVFVSNHTVQFDDGNKETMVHENAPDGTYIIQAQFTEDCAGWNLNWICLDQRSTTVTIRIYLNTETTPRWTLNADLDTKGESAQWSLTKASGIWNDPVAMP